MGALVRLHALVFGTVERVFGDWFLGLLARFTFAAVLLAYFWNSALTKIGPGLLGVFGLSPGAYVQIFPKRMEAVGYDPSQLSFVEHLVTHVGTYAEFLLPALIVVGLLTRLASLGMIVFIAVMTAVDITGHGVDAATIGAWFDRQSGAAIADDRTLWVFLLLVLVLRGPGPVSLDWVLGRRYRGR